MSANDKLQKLERLYQMGSINTAQYNQAKQTILSAFGDAAQQQQAGGGFGTMGGVGSMGTVNMGTMGSGGISPNPYGTLPQQSMASPFAAPNNPYASGGMDTMTGGMGGMGGMGTMGGGMGTLGGGMGGMGGMGMGGTMGGGMVMPQYTPQSNMPSAIMGGASSVRIRAPTRGVEDVPQSNQNTPLGPKTMYILERTEGGLLGKESFPVYALQPMVVGKDPSADIRIRGERVDRQHAVIQHRTGENGAEKVFILDVGSTTGIWVNNQQIQRKVYCEIKPGDHLRFGERFGSTSYLLRLPDTTNERHPDGGMLAKANASAGAASAVRGLSPMAPIQTSTMAHQQNASTFLQQQQQQLQQLQQQQTPLQVQQQQQQQQQYLLPHQQQPIQLHQVTQVPNSGYRFPGVSINGNILKSREHVRDQLRDLEQKRRAQIITAASYETSKRQLAKALQIISKHAAGDALNQLDEQLSAPVNLTPDYGQQQQQLPRQTHTTAQSGAPIASGAAVGVSTGSTGSTPIGGGPVDLATLEKLYKAGFLGEAEYRQRLALVGGSPQTIQSTVTNAQQTTAQTPQQRQYSGVFTKDPATAAAANAAAAAVSAATASARGNLSSRGGSGLAPAVAFPPLSAEKQKELEQLTKLRDAGFVSPREFDVRAGELTGRPVGVAARTPAAAKPVLPAPGSSAEDLLASMVSALEAQSGGNAQKAGMAAVKGTGRAAAQTRKPTSTGGDGLDDYFNDLALDLDLNLDGPDQAAAAAAEPQFTSAVVTTTEDDFFNDLALDLDIGFDATTAVDSNVEDVTYAAAAPTRTVTPSSSSSSSSLAASIAKPASSQASSQASPQASKEASAQAQNVPHLSVPEPQVEEDEPAPVPPANNDPKDPNFDMGAYKQYMVAKYEWEQRQNARALVKVKSSRR